MLVLLGIGEKEMGVNEMTWMYGSIFLGRGKATKRVPCSDF